MKLFKVLARILALFVILPIFLYIVLVFIFLAVESTFADTVPLRGINTIARGTNYPPDVPLTSNQLIMSISMNAPPALPLVTNRARLKQIRDDYYEIENLDPEDIIFSRNKPTVTQTKSGWRITFK